MLYGTKNIQFQDLQKYSPAEKIASNSASKKNPFRWARNVSQLARK
jgi:hypothetical protein